MGNDPSHPNHDRMVEEVERFRNIYDVVFEGIVTNPDCPPWELDNLHGARWDYLTAHRAVHTATDHAAECLKTGALSSFLDVLDELTPDEARSALLDWGWNVDSRSDITHLAFLQGLQASGKVQILEHQTAWSLLVGGSLNDDVAELVWLLEHIALTIPKTVNTAGNLFELMPCQTLAHSDLWVAALLGTMQHPGVADLMVQAFTPWVGYALDRYPPQALAAALAIVPLDDALRANILAHLATRGWSAHRTAALVARWTEH